MDISMDSRIKIYRALLITSFVSQLLLDLLGYKGAFYNLYDEAVFNYSGHGSFISFKLSFALYLTWALLHYVSIVLLYIFNKVSLGFAFVALALSFIMAAISGVWVATPPEQILGWISVFAYDIAFALALFYSPINSRIHGKLNSSA